MSILGEASAAYGPDYPQPGWAEQSPALWEDGLAPTIDPERANRTAYDDAYGAYGRLFNSLGPMFR